jgi:hypothetical protein
MIGMLRVYLGVLSLQVIRLGPTVGFRSLSDIYIDRDIRHGARWADHFTRKHLNYEKRGCLHRQYEYERGCVLYMSTSRTAYTGMGT